MMNSRLHQILTHAGAFALGVIMPASIASAAIAIDEDAPWPRVRSTNGNTITLYLPQVERWSSNWFNARAAVEVKLANAKESFPGVIWIEAHGSVDTSNRMVTLDRLDVVRGRFPEATDGGSNALAAVREVLPSSARTVSLDYLVTALGFAQAAAREGVHGMKHTPPEILWVTNRTVLVIIDGEPVLRPTETAGLERVVNTPALLVYDKAAGKFYLSGQGNWFTSDAIKGSWSLAQQVPPAIGALSEATNAPPATGEAPPRILISTTPAELVNTTGLPEFKPIRGTSLQFAADTDSQLFYDTKAKAAYLLISGRWFKANSLNGPWTHVAPHDLPEDFAKIPPGSAQAIVRASVPGTPEAELALVANSVPTTATVKRSEAKIDLTYDGAPQFKPIEGTSMSYAINAKLPVIRLGDSYYAVDDGVWFTASAAEGPWEVAAEVPEEIYTIPPSSPVYYATFARVYDANDDEVEVGYTAGYQGAYEDDGTVVYGTGYNYEPWYGYYYYSWGWTWGYGYVYVPWYQWWAWRPWWRPVHGLWFTRLDNIYHRWQNRPGVNPTDPPLAGATRRSSARESGYPALYGRFQGSQRAAALDVPANTLAVNPYTRPKSALRPGEIPRGAQMLSTVRQTPGGGRDLYASPDGNVYQRRNDGWYQRQASGKWNFAAPTQGSIRQSPAAGSGNGTVYRPTGGGGNAAGARAGRVPNAGGELSARDVNSLERQYYARSLAQMRTQNYRAPANRPAAGARRSVRVR